MRCRASLLRRTVGPRRPFVLASALLALAAATTGPAGAQASGGAGASPGGSLDGILRALDLKAKPAAADPDFVRDSRPATTGYLPVGRAHPDRPVKVMTPEELAAQTESLDKARVAQQRGAGVTPPPVPLKPAKGAPPRRTSKLR